MKAKFTQFDAVVNILFILSHIQTLAQWHMLTNSEECIEYMYSTVFYSPFKFSIEIKFITFILSSFMIVRFLFLFTWYN